MAAEAPQLLRPRPLWVSLHCAAPSTRSGGIVVGALFGVNPEVLGAPRLGFGGALVWALEVHSIGIGGTAS